MEEPATPMAGRGGHSGRKQEHPGPYPAGLPRSTPEGAGMTAGVTGFEAEDAAPGPPEAVFAVTVKE
jgi:hypothetical protein